MCAEYIVELLFARRSRVVWLPVSDCATTPWTLGQPSLANARHTLCTPIPPSHIVRRQQIPTLPRERRCPSRGGVSISSRATIQRNRRKLVHARFKPVARV